MFKVFIYKSYQEFEQFILFNLKNYHQNSKLTKIFEHFNVKKSSIVNP